MATYRHILLAVDLTPKCHDTVIKAKKVADTFLAKISMMHVIERYASGIYQLAAEVDIERKLVEDARQQLEKIAVQYGVDTSNCFVEVGAAKFLVLDKAQDIAADLIIVGKYGRHGIANILGSTATAIAHHADRDVFIIHE